MHNAHFYERPSKSGFLTSEETEALSELRDQAKTVGYLDEDEFNLLQSYLHNADSIANTGRFVDFVDYDYATFYADYPTTVPLLVKAGIVKEQNGELVVDYIYNEGDVIPAHTGVILKGDCRGNAYIMEEATTTTDATSPAENLLHGTTTNALTEVDGCDRYYKLSFDAESDTKLGFYWGDSEGANPFYNKPYKAFLALPASMNAVKMEGFSLSELEKGTVTAIATNEANKPVEKGIYTIDGRKLNATSTNNLPAGIYIVNGKKVVVK